MKQFGLVLGAMLALSALAGAAQMPPAPTPTPMPEGTVIPASSAVELYHCVRYKDERNIHPCAVPMIVSVPDPCPDPCNPCAQKCVYVKICVPPCDCYETKCRKSGRKIVYDFGKYEVEITASRGTIVVDYDD